MRSSVRPAVLATLTLVLLALPLRLPAADQAALDATAPVLPLWPGVPPGSEGKTGPEKVRLQAGEHIVSNIHQPSLTIYLPLRTKATGAGVVICPGGGHRELWMDHEGYRVAHWLNDHGIAAFILKYRLAREVGSTYRVEVESLADAQRALRFVHAYAADWHVDPARIGIIGFSAGGELAALAAARVVAGDPAAIDPIDQASSRPAFQGLIYPGNAKSIEPAAGAPAAFLLAGDADTTTPPDELARAYLRFHAAGVPVEFHVFTGAGHGFGAREGNTTPAGHWLERFRDWLDERGFLRPAPPPAAKAP